MNAILPGIGLPYSNFTGTIAQALRPWPQYSGVSDVWGDVGNSNYNSFQFILNKRLSHGFNLNLNYTYARAFDDTLANMVTGQTSSGRTPYNWKIEKAQEQIPQHVFNIFGFYQLPIGKGHLLGRNSAIVQKIAGGWQVGGIGTYRSGTVIGTIGAACNLPNAGTCYADYNPAFSGPVRINGGYGSGDLLGSTPTVFLNRQGFVSPAPFTYGNTPRTNVFGVRNPGIYDVDLNVSRTFAITERVKFALEGDAFNILNLVTFAPPSTNITSNAFGRITAQSNTPRILQFSGRVTF